MTDASSCRLVVLGLGSNLGDRLGYLQAAIDVLAAAPGVNVVDVSPVYETVPVGGPEQADFLNAVAVTESTLEPEQILRLAQAAENVAGRTRFVRWGPRTLDVDILFIDGVVMASDELVLPHPRLADRGFVLRPWADVDPGRVVAEGATVSDLLAKVDISGVRRTMHELRLPS